MNINNQLLHYEAKPQHGSEEKKTKQKIKLGKNAFEEEKSLTKMKSKEVAEQIKSIDHFIFLYENEGKYFLPPRKLITWHYVRQILSGQKHLLKFEQLKSLYTLPKFRGLSVNSLFIEMNEDTEFNKFFPDIPANTNVPREYFLQVSIIRSLKFLDPISSLNSIHLPI